MRRKTDRVNAYSQAQRAQLRDNILRVRHSLADDPPKKRQAVATSGGFARWLGLSPEERRAEMNRVRAGERKAS